MLFNFCETIYMSLLQFKVELMSSMYGKDQIYMLLYRFWKIMKNLTFCWSNICSHNCHLFVQQNRVKILLANISPESRAQLHFSRNHKILLCTFPSQLSKSFYVVVFEDCKVGWLSLTLKAFRELKLESQALVSMNSRKHNF